MCEEEEEEKEEEEGGGGESSLRAWVMQAFVSVKACHPFVWLPVNAIITMCVNLPVHAETWGSLRNDELTEQLMQSDLCLHGC